MIAAWWRKRLETLVANWREAAKRGRKAVNEAPEEGTDWIEGVADGMERCAKELERVIGSKPTEKKPPEGGGKL